MSTETENTETENTETKESTEILINCPEPDWRVCMAHEFYIYMSSKTANIPNWFHRYAQRVILGFKWEKIK